MNETAMPLAVHGAEVDGAAGGLADAPGALAAAARQPRRVEQVADVGAVAHVGERVLEREARRT